MNIRYVPVLACLACAPLWAADAPKPDVKPDAPKPAAKPDAPKPKAAKPNPTWADPVAAAKEDADFAIQGEYVGEGAGPDGKPMKFGVQIVAQGDGKFLAKGHTGGLPGAGWDKIVANLGHGKGQKSDDGSIVFTNDKGCKATLKDGKLSVVDPEGKPAGAASRVERVSPTMGEKAPAGAVVLFDGTKDSLKHWKPGARVTDDGLLMEGVTSAANFQDFHIHLEFRLPYMPYASGQGRGNSGLYMQGRYETQILDSFGLKGENNECGGIYTIKAPDENMCLPPLAWQTYDVDFKAAKFGADGKKTANARMTVRLNGVIIHKDVELPKTTTAAPVKEGSEPGPIYLQNHGNPIRFRNIWVQPAPQGPNGERGEAGRQGQPGRLAEAAKEAPKDAPKAAAPAPDAEGFVALMDGKTFDNWKMSDENKDSWTIKDGAFVAKGNRCHLFYAGDDKPFKNFELRLEVMTKPTSNGGVYFHTQYQEKSWPKHGFECQVNNTYNKDPRKTGSVYAVKDVKEQVANDNEWWSYVIRVEGKKATLSVNGKVVNEYVEPEGTKPGKDFTRVFAEGTFALQAHDPGSEVHYRAIKVKRLP